MLVNKDLTFRPKINEVSKKIDKQAVQNYENQNSVDYLLRYPSLPVSNLNTRPPSALAKLRDKPININANTNSVGYKGTSAYQTLEKEPNTQAPSGNQKLSYQEQAEQMYDSVQRKIHNHEQSISF